MIEMNSLFKILLFSLLVVCFTACQKDYTDTSFINSNGAPSKLTALTTIAQDNSGLVTITPNGENASYFEVYFGDITTAPSKVVAGASVQHIYAEGVYSLKLVAHSISGSTTTLTQQLTVSFRAPESLTVSALTDLANNFKINLSASALYETYFKVYFGDVVNEVPQAFLQGDTIGHVYPSIGKYIIKVVAFSGSKDSIIKRDTITILDPLVLPLTFESSTLKYGFVDFAGAATSVIDNPQMSGVNTSFKVAQLIKNSGQTYAGTSISLSTPIDFSKNKVFRMKVFSPRVGATALLKVENASDNTKSFEISTPTTVANGWEDLVFNYSAINTADAYSKITIIFDLGIMGDGSANFTYLFDDIRLTNVLPSSDVAFPLDFESSTINYSFTDFNGGGVSIISNPFKAGINTSNKVAQMIKSGGAVYGGSYLPLTNPVDFTSGKKFTMNVYSPRKGAHVLLKFENLTDGGISTEVEVATTTANSWEQLTFDFSSKDVSKSYQKVVLIFDNGTMGDGSANFTYLFDNISQQ